jgi:nitrogen fixation protein NifB
MAELKVDVLNCMPVYPHPETPFGEIPEPRPEQMAAIQAAAEEYLPQMRHCTRCRADAVGLLEEDRSQEFQDCLSRCTQKMDLPEDRPYVAVASREGMLVNLHLGEAASFQIWGPNGRGYRMVAERPAPPTGGGEQRWWALAETLKDCRAVLVSALGETPRAILDESGVAAIETGGFIEQALQVIYSGGPWSLLKGRRGGLARPCSGGRDGPGGGCL